MMSYDYPHPVSRTYQYKKITKPLLERKRRARINRCLDELKDLMVDALETEGENISKLEKADILELTVRHLQRLHASRPSGLSPSAGPDEDVNSAESRWQSGFGHCAAEACRYLASLPGESGERLAGHLASGLQTTSRQKNVGTPRKNESTNSENEIDDIFQESSTLNVPMEIVVPSDSRSTESPIDTSSRYSTISESSECPDATASVIPIRVSADSAQQKEQISTKILNAASSTSENEAFNNVSVITRVIESTVCKTDGRPTAGDDEEEIDVEGIDERDPMWRPW